MNKVVLKLAHDTVAILSSACEEIMSEAKNDLQLYFRKWYNYTEFSEFPESISYGSIEEICSDINSTLNLHEKVYLLLIVQECLLKYHDNQRLTAFLNKIYDDIGVDISLISKFRNFLEREIIDNSDDNEFLLLSSNSNVDKEMLEGQWIEKNVNKGNEISEKIPINKFQGHLLVMFVNQIKSYIIRSISRSETKFDQENNGYCSIKLLSPGENLSINGIKILSFSDLKGKFLQHTEKKELTLSIDSAEYINDNGKKELHSFSSLEKTGQLIGIVGREGVGKSTLLKLLAGKFKPSSGEISINGYDLWKNKYLLKGVIGFVPEEDLLFEELTVGENLTLTARLYYSHLSKKEINARVNTLLGKMDLIELKHVIVGGIDSKHIQPGQRRLINIALELLREPQILLVDNALSGLGMSDACKVIKVLHEYSFSGNLVITSISQVDSETFQLFDKIWIVDDGGYLIYNGRVKEATDFLLSELKINYSEKSITDPAKLLDWLNYRLPDKENHVWKKVLDPDKLHKNLIRKQALENENKPSRSILPARILKIPNLEVQLFIFSIRNFKCKFSKFNQILKSLLIGPLAGLIISILFRSTTEENYSLLMNPNLPLYQFLSVIIAIFLGLIASIDEIIRERNIIEKEEYLEFSRFSYLNSKILYIFPILAIQTLLYLITANTVLGINEMFWHYWLILFSSACFGGLLGLVFSSGLSSWNILHKAMLPVAIALQIFLGGGIISYEQLNLGNHKYSPLIGDLIVAKWGYEALAVQQFKKNSFEKLIYDSDKRIDLAAFYTYEGLPAIEQAFNKIISSSDKDSVNNNLKLFQNEIKKIATFPEVFHFEYLNRIPEILNNKEIEIAASDYLYYLSRAFSEQYQQLLHERSLLMGRLSDSIGAGNLALLRQKYHNIALEETVTQSGSEKSFNRIDNEIIRTSGSIYSISDSGFGRSLLFSPYKKFNGQLTDTFWFNISIIWLLASICYIWVLFDFTAAIRKIVPYRKHSY